MSETKNNLIFDLGYVLVSFNSKKLLHDLFDPDIAERIFSLYFPDLWNIYDQGLITSQEMIEKGIEQCPDLKQEIYQWMEHWYEYVEILDKNIRIRSALKEREYGIYILSNIPWDTYKYLDKVGLFDGIDGGVFSCQEQRIKPDKKIYEILLDRYHLNPEDCLFIDDTKVNLLPAKELGMETIWLEQPD